MSLRDGRTDGRKVGFSSFDSREGFTSLCGICKGPSAGGGFWIMALREELDFSRSPEDGDPES